MHEQEKKQARRSLAKVSDYKVVFSSPQGKKVLLDMMSGSHMLAQCFTGDREVAIFRDGERNTVLKILKLLRTDEKTLREMTEQESQNDSSSNQYPNN